MPELPEVETTCVGIRPYLLEQQALKFVVRESRLRWPVEKKDSKNFLGQTLRSVTRRAKYILLNFDTGTLVIHLGMSGSLSVTTPTTQIKKHDHVDLVFSDSVILRYHDPRRFGSILWVSDNLNAHRLFAHLGPEPLSDGFDGEYLFQRSRKRKLSIKQFIMDAGVVVGVGNIYANEALFNSGIHPTREAGSLSRKKLALLAEQIQKVLSNAIKQGGTTLRDYQDPSGKLGYFVQSLRVYGRKGEPCVSCGRQLQEVRLNNRSTVFCSRCQR